MGLPLSLPASPGQHTNGIIRPPARRVQLFMERTRNHCTPACNSPSAQPEPCAGTLPPRAPGSAGRQRHCGSLLAGGSRQPVIPHHASRSRYSLTNSYAQQLSSRNPKPSGRLLICRNSVCCSAVFLLRSLLRPGGVAEIPGRFSSSLPPSFASGRFAAILYSAQARCARAFWACLIAGARAIR
jgi:hypothetical protein